MNVTMQPPASRRAASRRNGARCPMPALGKRATCMGVVEESVIFFSVEASILELRLV